MAEAIVSTILEQLASILADQAAGEFRLIAGAEEEVENLRSSFLAVKAVLDDAEKRQVKETAVRDWLDKLKHISYDTEDVLDEWNTSVGKLQMRSTVCSFCIPSYWFSPRQLVLRHKFAAKIKNLNKTLDNISRQKDMFNYRLTSSTKEVERQITTSFIDLSTVHGRDQKKNEIVDLLLCESNQEVSSLPIIAIVGMGGIGKTTLARLLYHDDRVNTHFDYKIWVCVSDPFDEIRIARAILESLQSDAANLVELQTLLQKISQILETKKFFLVLDDVWTEDPNKWEQLRNSLKCGSRGSRILLTTRKECVAKIMGTTNMISLGKLPEEECWLLFSQVAFFGRTREECVELEDIGRKILGKCKGLPLAVKTVASLLSLKTRVGQWQRVLDSEMWQLEEIEKGVFPPLLLSYYDLSSNLKKCFSYCAIFPKDYRIRRNKLIKLWMAQDYLKMKETDDMELVGEEYFEKLAMRSFFQDFERDCDSGSIISCKMHDIVHDFAQFLTKNECFTIEVDGSAVSQLNSASENARHLMMMIFESFNTPFPSYVCERKKLRSIMVDEYTSNLGGDHLSKLFDKLTCLRTIDWRIHPICSLWRFFSIEQIPRGIGKLKHLRYLGLEEFIYLKELPEDLCDLYNLQTLDISYCRKLQSLPQNIGKLINLRHLINEFSFCLRYMPNGMERLTCLRTLSEFVVKGGDIDDDDGKASSLECLKNLNYLQGSLVLKGLGNVIDVGEAEKADLRSKTNLLRLTLEFVSRRSRIHDETKSRRSRIHDETNNDEDVLEALQPPSNLVKLEISDYRGTTLSPSWMLSLENLRELKLVDFHECHTLAGLGKLPSLESLSLIRMSGLERVGIEFLGIDSNVGSGRSSSSSILAFPKLKRLEFMDLDDWEEWDYGIISEDIRIMPHLDHLSITFCPKLKTLPDHLLQKGIFLHRNYYTQISWSMNK